MRHFWAGALAALVLFSAGCRSRDEGAQSQAVQQALPAPRAGVKLLPDIAARNSRFAFNLFGRLHAAQPDENLFISPFSISSAFSLAYYGAAGDTAKAIEETMQWQGATPDQVSESLLSLRRSLSDERQITLTIADSLWLRQGESLKPEFTQAIAPLPATRVDTLDFMSPSSADTINGWVHEQTHGLISTITDAAELQDLVLLLLDAVYFRAPWQDEFKHGDTRLEPFTLASGAKKDVPLMDRRGDFRYLETAEFQAVRLFYKESSLSMLVLLPAKTSNLKSLVQSLTPARWEGLRARLSMQEGHLKLPRFTAENTQVLDPVLKAMGMSVLFEAGKADFSGMCDGVPQLSNVRQKAVLKVDEKGTEAAAVTAVPRPGMAPGAPAGPFEMVVDRPFFLAIVDDDTQAILFMGAIVAPEE